MFVNEKKTFVFDINNLLKESEVGCLPESREYTFVELFKFNLITYKNFGCLQFHDTQGN